jgi:heterodisulfide reductase subunit B
MCDCLTNINDLGKTRGFRVVSTFGAASRDVPARAIIETTKMEGTRKKPPALVANFCPFCGVSYERARARS